MSESTLHLRRRLDEMGYSSFYFDVESEELVRKLYTDLCDALSFISEQNQFPCQDENSEAVNYLKGKINQGVEKMISAARKRDEEKNINDLEFLNEKLTLKLKNLESENIDNRSILKQCIGHSPDGGFHAKIGPKVTLINERSSIDLSSALKFRTDSISSTEDQTHQIDYKSKISSYCEKLRDLEDYNKEILQKIDNLENRLETDSKIIEDLKKLSICDNCSNGIKKTDITMNLEYDFPKINNKENDQEWSNKKISEKFIRPNSRNLENTGVQTDNRYPLSTKEINYELSTVDMRVNEEIEKHNVTKSVNSVLENHINEQKFKISNLEKAIEDLKNELEGLNSEKMELRMKLETSQSDIDSKRKIQIKLDAQKDKMLKEINEKEARIKDQESELISHQQTIQTLNNWLSEKDITIE
ncbi:MAG: hypothetical protein MHPSP_000354 [Paramarteilia canceri]